MPGPPTYSTFAVDVTRPAVHHRPVTKLTQVANVVVSLIAGVGAAALGWAIGAALV